VSDLQSTSEHEFIYLLIIVGDLGELVLKEVDVRLEAVSQPHPDREEAITTPLGFLASGVLCEEGLDNLQEVVERVRCLGVKQLWCCTPQT